jgi:Flp pilus assembly protein TadD
MSATRSNQAAKISEGLALVAKRISTGKPEEAVQICRKMLMQFPNEPRVHYSLAVGYAQTGKLDEAVASYRTALRLKPDFFEVRVNLGTVLGSLGKFSEAVEEFSEATRLRPEVAEVHVNLSHALRDIFSLERAVSEAETAISLKPTLPEGHLCLGAALACQGKFDQAIAAYREAIRIRPDFAAAHLNLALALLVTGNLKEGLPEYEWRQRCSAALPPRRFAQPAWNGEPPAGKTILLYAEQGFGDAIHFIRYVPMVAKAGGKILLECQPQLIRLFQDLPGIDRIIPADQPAGHFDVHCALPSLPLRFNTTLDTIPASIPYLAAKPADIESWRQRIDRSENRLQVGLAWAGSAENRNDRNRSIPLAKFLPLTHSGRFQFHSLQITPPPTDSQFPMSDWSAHLKDFADTAGLIANLDLIISVDTAVAHLAAAMGKKVWLLVAFPPDWRWMLDRTDSPWYPTVELFRQEVPGDWDTVIRKLVSNI